MSPSDPAHPRWMNSYRYHQHPPFFCGLRHNLEEVMGSVGILFAAVPIRNPGITSVASQQGPLQTPCHSAFPTDLRSGEKRAA